MKASSTSTPKLLSHIRAQTLDTLESRLRRMMDKQDDALFDLANRATESRSQQLYFDAMRQLRVQRSNIEYGFSKALNRLFERFESSEALTSGTMPQARGETADEIDLELIEDTEMEESIAVANMAARILRSAHQELFELSARLAHLTGSQDVDSNNHPLSPTMIARAFEQTVDDLEMDIQINLIVLKLFDQHVMDALQPLYARLNQLLADEGVLPKIGRSVKKPPVEQTGRTSAPAGPGDRSPGEAATVGPQDPRLLKALNELQDRIAQGSPAPPPLELREQVLELPSHIASQSSAADQRLRYSVDMVSLAFDYILNDPNIPDETRNYIARLQLPVLKAALEDDAFFTLPDRPARQLLNELAQASTTLSSNHQSENDPLRRKIRSVVDRLVNAHEADNSVFQDLLDDFLAFLHNEDSRARIFEERARQTAEGRDRLEYAKRRVDAWIEAWTSREDIPEFIADFLSDTWKNTLLITLLQHGEGSESWNAQVNTINGLLWSISPKNNPEESHRLIRVLPTLLKFLRAGADLASAHPYSTSRLLTGLAPLHVEAAQAGFQHDVGPSEEPAYPDTEGYDVVFEDPEQVILAGYSDPEQADSNPPQPEELELVEEVAEEIIIEPPSESWEGDEHAGQLDEYERTARNLAPGTWVEFGPVGAARKRAKLSWRSKRTPILLFVDRQGLSAGERNVEDLARALRNGEARVLGERPSLDRAIEEAASNLGGQEPQPPGSG